MKPNGEVNTLPNYRKRVLFEFLGQAMLIAVLFVWSDAFPLWVNWTIVAAAILCPPTAYLTALAKPSLRQAWRELLREVYLFIISIPPAASRLFSLATLVKLVRLVFSLKGFPETTDGWITLTLLPFKTYVVVAYPFLWVPFALFYPVRGAFREMSAIIYMGYVYSLLPLLLGALAHALFCRAGRATITLLLFAFGISGLMY